MDRTVVALYEDVNIAHRAVEELLSNGFDRNDISVVRTNQTSAGGVDTETTAGGGDASGMAAGAGVGAALGGLAGLVVGLGALAIPGIGPIVAAGPLATTLAGAGIGAVAGGLIGALTDIGIPEEEAGYYAEGVRRGGTLVTVRATGEMVGRASEILNRFSPTDVTQRAEEWRSSGWTGYDAGAGTTGTGGYSGAGSYSGTGGTSMGVTGSGMSGSGSYSRRFEDFNDDFRNDWQTRYSTSGYGYERYQPAYQYGWQLGERYQDRDWNDFESDARSDWQRNHPNDRWEDFKDSVRTGWERFKRGASNIGRDTDRDMDRSRAGGTFSDTGRDFERGYDRTTSDMSRSFDTYDRDFRSNWEQSYRSSGYDYDRFRPAYQYGYTLANDRRYRGRDWNDFERDARRDWETQHPGDRWEDVKDAVRHAWQRVRADVRNALD
jgi:hypothetical protein